MSINIAIDGPAGAGKSTIAKKVAKNWGYIYVDTGAMYRTLALHFMKNGITADSDGEMKQLCDSADIVIKYENNEQQLYLNGENVTSFLRTEEVGIMASSCAKNPDVRKKLVAIQQNMAAKTDLVMDGRDIGTTVLPEADVKIYLTASVEVRAKRRYDELVSKGIDCDLEKIMQDIADRDYQDINREHSPLRCADDAILVDSSELTIGEVVQRINDIIGEKING